MVHKKREEVNFEKNAFGTKLKIHTKVIWYENIEEDSISVFTRLNIGKIGLSNSELIKALFLNSSNFNLNFTEKNKPELERKQLEISIEWDNIENTLHNDRFWYFMSDEEKSNNRIEFIFDIISEKYENPQNKYDNFFTFRFFNKKFINKTEKIIKENWEEIKNYFQRFYEWYLERNLYHKIGYLIYITDITIQLLSKKFSEMTKSEFEIHLDDLIKKSLSNVEIDKLDYDDDYKDIKKVLLLYNILTVLQNDKEDSKFPFDIFKNKNNGWDIEHITAKKDGIMPKREEDKKEWLKNVLPYIDSVDTNIDITGINKENELEESKKIKKRINDCLKLSNRNFDEIFNDLFSDIIIYFKEDIGEDVDHISNLALLDSNTNKSYKNAVFLVKRETIIERDKNGRFIPICTKNVFLKYYTEYPPKFSFWTKEDREKYKEDLKRVLEYYLEK